MTEAQALGALVAMLLTLLALLSELWRISYPWFRQPSTLAENRKGIGAGD
jgi:hypothetical protein